jgi:hypothetical protein
VWVNQQIEKFMKLNLKHGKAAIVLTAMAIATAAIAATALSFSAAVNVSQTTTPTEKAKSVRLAYQDGSVFKKAWLYTYGDGEVGRENVYAKYSFDEGATWSAPILLSRDAAGNPTGGQSITTRGGNTFIADNNKPNIFAPPTTDRPNVVVTWTSAYCPADLAAANNAGSYASAVQGQSALVDGGAIDHPFFCLWTATTNDPALSSWTTTQLTNGERDAIGDVASGNSKGQGFALAWQEDPAGLQPGEAEGPGDGGSGSTVSSGTNIWYTYAPNLGDGTIFRTNIRRASDNYDQVTSGAPGASRPNLSISGKTAVLAYEETACTGGSTGKCIVYHSFPYDQKTWTPTDAAGTAVSDVTQNARRVRFVLQGAEAAPSSNLRTLLLWRQSAPSAISGTPADIVVRRGLANASAPGSSGFAAADILLDTPLKLTSVAAGCGNANAHRALIRNNFIALAYDMTPSMDGSNPEKSNPTTANYNLYLTRSLDSGATWEAARNLTNLTDVSVRVVEPRIVPTPGTINNPTINPSVPDAGDTQNTNTFFIAYATEGNDASAAAGKVYVSRTTDQGATFEAFVPVSSDAGGQSEAQLRATPDGSVVAALWMQEQANGNKDAMFAMATPAADEPLATTTPAVSGGGSCPAPTVSPPPVTTGVVGGGGCSAVTGQQALDPVLPMLAVLGLIGLLARRWRIDSAAGLHEEELRS